MKVLMPIHLNPEQSLYDPLDGDGYRVRREIKEMILFANHNFLKDPPFSKLDLVTCRNVLIYLNNTAQLRVTDTFHFAFRAKGFLSLGSSEPVDGTSELYSNHNREHHVYLSKETSPRTYPVPDSAPKLSVPASDLRTKSIQTDRNGVRISFGELHQRMLISAY